MLEAQVYIWPGNYTIMPKAVVDSDLAKILVNLCLLLQLIKLLGDYPSNMCSF